ncbi:MAG: prolipoprotein diacylglyceryl transferase [Oscillospiraceae bacterium]|nr:prolipoprotein diacylglyceryl transferase [Oscillospiraceae bacterium]
MLRPLINFHYWGINIYLLMALIGLFFAVKSLSDKQKQIHCTPAVRKTLLWCFSTGLAAGVICANIANWFLFPAIGEYPLLRRFAEGGFSFYYGMLGFFGISALLLKTRKLDYPYWIDRIVPSVLIFHAFGRVGCALEGCCWGREVHLAGLTFDFPARELEAAALFALYYLFEKKLRRRHFFWYLFCYAILRFGLEFGRGDDRGILFVTWLSPAQVTAAVILLVLGIWELRRRIYHRAL